MRITGLAGRFKFTVIVRLLRRAAELCRRELCKTLVQSYPAVVIRTIGGRFRINPDLHTVLVAGQVDSAEEVETAPRLPR